MSWPCRRAVAGRQGKQTRHQSAPPLASIPPRFSPSLLLLVSLPSFYLPYSVCDPESYSFYSFSPFSSLSLLLTLPFYFSFSPPFLFSLSPRPTPSNNLSPSLLLPLRPSLPLPLSPSLTRTRRSACSGHGPARRPAQPAPRTSCPPPSLPAPPHHRQKTQTHAIDML